MGKRNTSQYANFGSLPVRESILRLASFRSFPISSSRVLSFHQAACSCSDSLQTGTGRTSLSAHYPYFKGCMLFLASHIVKFHFLSPPVFSAFLLNAQALTGSYRYHDASFMGSCAFGLVFSNILYFIACL